jgi:dienelactone hydrolase
MIRTISLLAALFGAVVFVCPCTAANAQEEFPPPQGKGPVVVVVSGQLGAAHYEPPARQIAAMGYDVILLDGNDMEGTHGQALRDAVQKAQSSAHGLPGKVGVVGFSLGGGESLAYAGRWSDLVAVVIAWYPYTSGIHDMAALGRGIKVPVLMFAGESDHYKDCCLIENARKIAAAASEAGTPLELVAYPDTEHDFIFTGRDYNADATADSWQRATAKLAQYLGH